MVTEYATITTRPPGRCQLCGRRARLLILLRNRSTGRYLRVGVRCNENRRKIADSWWDAYFRRERVRAWREGRLAKEMV